MLAKNSKQKLILFTLLITIIIIAGCSANQPEQINGNNPSTPLENQNSVKTSEKSNNPGISIKEQDAQSKLENKDQFEADSNSSTSLESENSSESFEKNNKTFLPIKEQDEQSEFESKDQHKKINTPQIIDN